MPKTVEELAEASSSHTASLYRLLRMLAGAGMFAEEAPRRFGLTPLASTLRTDAPDSVRDSALFIAAPPVWALFIAARPVWAAWGNLLHSVQTGESVFDHTFAVPYQIARRCEVVAGDMLESVPAGADAYLLKCCHHRCVSLKALAARDCACL